MPLKEGPKDRQSSEPWLVCSSLSVSTLMRTFLLQQVPHGKKLRNPTESQNQVPTPPSPAIRATPAEVSITVQQEQAMSTVRCLHS